MLVSAVWSKIGAVGIRTKIMCIVAVCILSVTSALVWYTYHDVSAALKSQLQERGIAIGTSLAAQSRDHILTHNLFGLYKLVRDTRFADKDLVYAFILDAEGNVLVHTFDEGFPTDLLEVNRMPTEEAYRVQTLQTEDDTIQDVAIPVLGGKAGVVRLGLSEATINASIAEYVRHILLWVALILVLGLFIAYGLASILTRPLSRLAEAARAVGKGDFRWESPVWLKDEIGSLGTAFNEMSRELKRKEEIRTQLLAKVIGAQEEERRRISRELHDEASQCLAALVINLEAVEDTLPVRYRNTRQKLGILKEQAIHILEEIHSLALRLRPSALDDLGLPKAIDWYAKDYLAKHDLDVKVEVIGPKTKLPSYTETMLFRIVQEALTNVVKHAEADEVRVRLELGDSMVSVQVEDNGKGFDTEAALRGKGNRGNLGLHAMAERATLLEGAFTIRSQPGQGTCLRVEVPLMEGNIRNE